MQQNLHRLTGMQINIDLRLGVQRFLTNPLIRIGHHNTTPFGREKRINTCLGTSSTLDVVDMKRWSGARRNVDNQMENCIVGGGISQFGFDWCDYVGQMLLVEGIVTTECWVVGDLTTGKVERHLIDPLGLNGELWKGIDWIEEWLDISWKRQNN